MVCWSGVQQACGLQYRLQRTRRHCFIHATLPSFLIRSLELSQRLHAAFKNDLQILNESDYLIPGVHRCLCGMQLAGVPSCLPVMCRAALLPRVPTTSLHSLLPNQQPKWTARRPGTPFCASSCRSGSRSCRRSRWARGQRAVRAGQWGGPVNAVQAAHRSCRGKQDKHK